MLVSKGEKVHVITRPLYATEPIRHFAGEVLGANDVAMRVQGYVFVYEPERLQFVRRAEVRTRIVGYADAGHIIKVIPEDVVLEALTYRLDRNDRLVVTDGKGFSLDINEFLAPR